MCVVALSDDGLIEYVAVPRPSAQFGQKPHNISGLLSHDSDLKTAAFVAHVREEVVLEQVDVGERTGSFDCVPVLH